MHRIDFIPVIIMTLMLTSLGYGKDIPFTQEDRDRLIRLETKVEEGYKSLNQRIDNVDKSVNQRIDDLRDEIRDLKTFMLWGFGILFGGMALLITVVIWDRRTALSPVIRRNKELEDRVETIFKEYSKIEPKFAKILKATGFF